jgi:hypothetical protein
MRFCHAHLRIWLIGLMVAGMLSANGRAEDNLSRSWDDPPLPGR